MSIFSHPTSISKPELDIVFGSPNPTLEVEIPRTGGAARTVGTSSVAFHVIEAYISDKPLRIRSYDASIEVARLAEQWLRDRPRGVDLHRAIDTPAYREIVRIGLGAVRPLLLMLKREPYPAHWLPALQKITHANPVPTEFEGNIEAMKEAWIHWGNARGYLTDMD